MAGRSDLFSLLDSNHIKYETVDHPAFFTVEDGRQFKAEMPGGHSKNLFLKDKKKALSLAVAHCDTQVDLVGLGKTIGSKGRLSFGKREPMLQVLGATPGLVTPFALINAASKALSQVVLDRALFKWEKLWFHPLENTASTSISPDDLLKFIAVCGFEPLVLDLTAPQADVAL